MIRPSDTTRGRAWLTNFLPEDEAPARQLLDSLHFVSLSEVRAVMQVRLRNLMKEGRIQTPALLVSALSREDLRVDKGRHTSQVAFDTFKLDDPINATPGSEGFVGNLIRDFVKSDPIQAGSLLPPSATLDDLRASCCRSIVILTDYAGSGTQLKNFAMTLTRHPTIRSWRSYGLVRLHALSYAASPQALDVLQPARSALNEVWTVESAPSFLNAPWTPGQRAAIEDICVRYAGRKNRNRALGFKGSAGLFATDASVPNNLPRILWQAQTGWSPFFEWRTVPPDLFIDLGSYAPVSNSQDAASRIGQSRLSKNLDSKYLRSTSDDMLLTLALLLDRSHTDVELANKLGKPLASAETLMQGLLTLGFVDGQRAVTPAGRRELMGGKRRPRRVSVKVQGRGDAYYPESMR